MSAGASESHLSSKFFNTFVWATGISLLLVIPILLLLLASLDQTFLIILLGVVGSIVNGIIAGVISMVIPTNTKIIYIPTSLVLTWILTSILSSVTGTNVFTLQEPKTKNKTIETYQSEYDVTTNKQADEFDAFIEDYEGE